MLSNYQNCLLSFFFQRWTDAVWLFGRKAQRKLAWFADISLLQCVSHALWVNPWLFQGAKWEGRAKYGKAELLPKTLNSFSGFVWLAQILWTFTFCGELLRINGIARDSWIEPQECRRFYIYHDVWLLTLPFIGPLPLQYPADLHAVLSVPPHSQGAGLLRMLSEKALFLVFGKLRRWRDVIAHRSDILDIKKNNWI